MGPGLNLEESHSPPVASNSEALLHIMTWPRNSIQCYIFSITLWFQCILIIVECNNLSVVGMYLK